MTNCLRLLLTKLGNGQKPVNQFDGLQMENSAMQNFYGNLPAFTSNLRNTQELTDTGKFGEKD